MLTGFTTTPTSGNVPPLQQQAEPVSTSHQRRVQRLLAASCLHDEILLACFHATGGDAWGCQVIHRHREACQQVW